MKTPDEIKRGLEVCSANADCNQCPYVERSCIDSLIQNALAYIRQLEEDRDILRALTVQLSARNNELTMENLALAMRSKKGG